MLATSASPLKTAGLLAITRPATTTAVTTPVTGSRRQRAETPLPSSMAMPRSTSGVARSVERMARPAVVSVMKRLSTPPTGVGCV